MLPKRLPGWGAPLEVPFQFQQGRQKLLQPLGGATLHLPLQDVDPLGIAKTGGLGNGLGVLLSGGGHQRHPEPTAHLAHQAGLNAQGRFVGAQQVVHQVQRGGNVVTEQGLANLQAGLAGGAHQGGHRRRRDGLAAAVEIQLLQLSGQASAVAAHGLRQRRFRRGLHGDACGLGGPLHHLPLTPAIPNGGPGEGFHRGCLLQKLCGFQAGVRLVGGGEQQVAVVGNLGQGGGEGRQQLRRAALTKGAVGHVNQPPTTAEGGHAHGG